MKSIGVSTIAQYAESPEWVFKKPNARERKNMKRGLDAHYEIAAGVPKGYSLKLVLGIGLFVFAVSGLAYVFF